MRKTPKEKLQKALKEALKDKPVQMEIDKGIITIKDDKGEELFSLKGKVKIEETLQVKECEKCNSEGRKKELEALELDRKQIETSKAVLQNDRENLKKEQDDITKRESTLMAREEEIKNAPKVLTK